MSCSLGDRKLTSQQCRYNDRFLMGLGIPLPFAPLWWVVSGSLGCIARVRTPSDVDSGRGRAFVLRPGPTATVSVRYSSRPCLSLSVLFSVYGSTDISIEPFCIVSRRSRRLCPDTSRLRFCLREAPRDRKPPSMCMYVQPPARVQALPPSAPYEGGGRCQYPVCKS